MTTAPGPGGLDDRRDETEPTAPEPTPAEPTATESRDAATEPVAPQPTVPEPTMSEPTASEPTASEPTMSEPTVESPDAVTEPVAGPGGPTDGPAGPTAGPGGPTGAPGGPGNAPGGLGNAPGGPGNAPGGLGNAPGGFRPPPPPPGTGGYATRFGLVRPVSDKYIAGVCGAFARATNTDPVLWRVALPVLTVLGGFGILLYLLGWLLIPAEGDSASPFESLIGRGWSSTSRILTLVLTVIAGGWLLGAVIGGITGKVVVFAAIIAVVVLVANSRGNAPWQQHRPPGSVWGQATGGPAAQPWWSAGTGTYTATPHADTVTDTPEWTPGAAPTGTASAGPASTGPATTGTGWPDATTPADPQATSAAYRPPFAPGGPFATARTDLGQPPTYQENFPGLQTAPPPARPPRRRSGVTRVTLSLTLIVVGILAVLDTSHAISISTPGYFAAALATMGLSLMVGSLFGRSRAPIWLGILLVLALMSSAVAHEYNGNELIRPTSLAQLDDTYNAHFANMTIDLRQLDFAGQNRTVNVHLTAGRILVQVPPDVDTIVNATIGAGEARLFDVRRSGTSVREHVSNVGTDGPGGGKITINADIRFAGQVEVVR